MKNIPFQSLSQTERCNLSSKNPPVPNSIKRAGIRPIHRDAGSKPRALKVSTTKEANSSPWVHPRCSIRPGSGEMLDGINTLSFSHGPQESQSSSSVLLGEPEPDSRFLEYESRVSSLESNILSEEPISSSCVIVKWEMWHMICPESV